jgi:hypothetical protein
LVILVSFDKCDRRLLLKIYFVNNLSQQLLESFDRLPEEEKQKVAAEILRRSINAAITSPTDEELTFSAEALFLSLDEWENEQKLIAS